MSNSFNFPTWMADENPNSPTKEVQCGAGRCAMKETGWRFSWEGWTIEQFARMPTVLPCLLCHSISLSGLSGSFNQFDCYNKLFANGSIGVYSVQCLNSLEFLQSSSTNVKNWIRFCWMGRGCCQPFSRNSSSSIFWVLWPWKAWSFDTSNNATRFSF